VSIRVVPDSTGFRRKVKNELDAIEAGLKIKVKAELDTTQLRRELAAATRGQSTKVTLRLDRSAAIREIRELWRVLQAYATANPIRVRLTADTSSLTSAFMAMNRLGSAGGGTQGNRSMITGLANLGRTSARTTLMALVPVLLPALPVQVSFQGNSAFAQLKMCYWNFWPGL
jgi:hypothetical protein